MRYAIFSDIHGNWQAWNAVLSDMYDSNVDVPVCLGDIVGYGPCPQQVLDGIREVTNNFVMGNHDAAATGVLDPQMFNDTARAVIEWTRDQLDPGAMDFLKDMPMVIEDGDLMFVHAEIEEPGRFLYIDTEEEAQDNFQYNTHRITFVGHTHDPAIFAQGEDGSVTRLEDSDCTLTNDQRYIVNVGSVGEPRNPEDIRARYVIYDSDTNELIFRRIEFDVEAYRGDLQQSGLSIKPYFLTVVDSYREAVAMAQKAHLMRDMRTPVHAPSLLQQRTRTIQSANTGRPPLRRDPLERPPPPPAPKLGLYISIIVTVLMLSLVAFIFLGGQNRPVWAKNMSEAVVGTPDDTPESSGGLPGKGATTIAGMIKEEMGISTGAEEPVIAEPTPIAGLSYWRIDKGDQPLTSPDMKVVVAGKTGLPTVAKVPKNGARNAASAIGSAWIESEASGLYSLSDEASFTFECFFAAHEPSKPAVMAGDRAGDLETENGWRIQVEPGDRITLSYQTGKSEPLNTSVFIPDLFDGKTHHLAVVWNHAESAGQGSLTLFINAEAEAQLPIPLKSIPQTGVLQKFALGSRPSKPQDFVFNGALDEVRFSSGAMPPSLLLSNGTAGVAAYRSTVVIPPKKIVEAKPITKPDPVTPPPKPDPDPPENKPAVPKGTPTKVTLDISKVRQALDDELVFYVPFDDYSGSKVFLDLSQNGRHMKLEKAKRTTGEDGKVGRAVQFANGGFSSYVVPFGDTKNLSISFWFRPDDEQVTSEGMANLIEIPKVALINYDNNRLGFNLSGFRATTVFDFEPDGNWHHFVFENDGEKTRIFKNGSRIIEVDRPTAARKLPAEMKVVLGAGASRFRLDEVAVWRRLLTKEEKLALVAMGKAKQPIHRMPPVGTVWKFDETDGQIFNDESGKFPLGSVGKPVSREPIAPAPVPLTLAANAGAAKISTLIQPPDADPSTFELKKKQGFTYECWILPVPQKLANLGRTNSKTPDAIGWRFALAPDPKGTKGTVMFRYENAEQPKAMASGLDVYDGNPHHFAAIWKPNAASGVGNLRVLVDGKSVANVDIPNSDIIEGKSDSLQIGGERNQFTIDELRFTPYALAPKQLLNYGDPKAVKPKPPAKPADKGKAKK